MKSLGTLTFWLVYPALWIYLKIGSRTRVLVIVDDSVLVLKSWLGPGQWGLPGGGLHRGEEPAVGASRELQEETGIKVSPEDLKYLYEGQANIKGLRFRYSCYYLVLTKRPNIKKQALEIAKVAWLPLKSVSLVSANAETYQAAQTLLKQPNLL
ncbi:MAG: NUDIX hydrolase [Candidatus Saccharibacteria bacterium]